MYCYVFVNNKKIERKLDGKNKIKNSVQQYSSPSNVARWLCQKGVLHRRERQQPAA